MGGRLGCISGKMNRKCNDMDVDAIAAIVNDGADAYRGVIPEDCFHDPYMPTCLGAGAEDIR